MDIAVDAQGDGDQGADERRAAEPYARGGAADVPRAVSVMSTPHLDARPRATQRYTPADAEAAERRSGPEAARNGEWARRPPRTGTVRSSSGA